MAVTACAPSYFGEALAEFRTRAGLSQNGFALLAGFDHSYISRLEMGKREPSRETVMVLARVLYLSAADRASLLIAAGYWPGAHGARLALERVRA
jgi:transcriptional regulator with XRE-family HTH domain